MAFISKNSTANPAVYANNECPNARTVTAVTLLTAQLFIPTLMKTVISILQTFYGIVLVVTISAVPIIFTLILIFTPPESDWKSGLLRTVLYLMFILPGTAFLNMANFFARLKRANPDVYAMVIENGHWFEHIALAGRSLLTNLHDRVSQIAAEPIGRISHGIHRYATATRYLNLFCFGYLVTGVLSLIGFFVYLKWVVRN